MTVLTWDDVGEHLYETGVDKGVLYTPTAGVYDSGVAWNGLTKVSETPSGADATALYADNQQYLNLVSVEKFGGTIEAYTYPDEFGVCDGTVSPNPGLALAQQSRRPFGLSYRTRLGNDTEAVAHGYKLHLVYNALAAPSQKDYETINDSPTAITLSWNFTTTPVPVTGHDPLALLTIDSTQVGSAALTAIENALYGTGGSTARLPLPNEIITMVATGAPTLVTPVSPTFVAGTGVITIPTVTGVRYRRADTNVIVPAGAMAALPTSGDELIIKAEPSTGAYAFHAMDDTDWSFTRT